MSGFSTRTVVDEARRNVLASPVRSTVTAVLALVVGAAAIAWTCVDVRHIERGWHAQRLAGAFVWEVRAQWTEGLSAERCDALRGVDGVLAAGGLLGSSARHAVTAPGERVAYYLVTPGLPSVVWPDDAGVTSASVVAGRDVGSELGWVPGVNVQLRHVDPAGASTSVGSHQVDGVAVAAARVDGFDRSLVVASAPTGRVDSCLVEAAPGADAALGHLLRGWFEPADAAVALRLHRSGALERDPVAELRARTSRWGPLLAGGVLSGSAAVTWWARRAEVAVYRMLGMRRGQVLRMVLVETSVMVLLPAQVGATAAVAACAAGGMSGALARALLLDDLRLLLVLSVAPLACLAAATSLVTWDALRGR